MRKPSLLNPELEARLVGSIEAGRLMIVCGAGLSMAAPSNLPSARAVAEACFDKYVVAIDPACDPALRENLEAFAEHFVPLGTFKSVFIRELVPWNLFARHPNLGHSAIADFLLTRTAVAALSANYDFLIERCAWEFGAEFRASLDGDQATVQSTKHSPLLKFHGCQNLDPEETVWTKSQLTEPIIAGRVVKSRMWMAANLREKDLLVVGFWTDWAYLNEVIGTALTGVTPLSVTVVDMATAQLLEDKAPDLWSLAHADHVIFTHVQEDGARFLDELRRAYSRSFLRKVIRAGVEVFEAETGGACDPQWLDVPDHGSQALYGLRRDAEGVPHTLPARQKTPAPSEILGFFHLLLRRAGSTQTPEGYSYNGLTIRVVNGANAVLSRMVARYAEPPSLPVAAITAAIGATNLGLPDDIVRAGTPGDIVRPASAGRWLDFAAAREALGL